MGKFLLVIMYAAFSFAGSLSVKVENQQITAKACNLKQGTKAVWFFVGQKGYAKNGIGQRENRFENNCAVKTYNNTSNDLFLKGGEVYASYDEAGKQPIQINPETVAIPGNTTQPPVNNPPPVVTPEDPRKEMDPKKVKIYAEQAANFFANRVVEIYGRVENYKYNFYLGFKRAASLYSNLGISIQNLPQYDNGRQNGLANGYEEGYRSGQQKGLQEGRYLGRQAAVGRFQAAVGNESGLDITPGSGPDASTYLGINPSLNDPDLGSKLQGYNNDYYSELKTENNFDAEVEFDSDLSGNIYGASISLSDYYTWNDYKNEVLFSYWKSENAFSLFLSKRLIKASSVDYNKVKANNEMIAKYKEITDPTQYKDAEENKRIYRSTFINQYDDVIGYKWNKEVYERSNPAAQARGEYYFTRAIQAYAYDVGYKQGYIVNYTPRSIQGYQSSLGPAYFQSFNETVSYYSTNPVLESVSLSLVNQEGKNTFAIIDNVLVVLHSAVNYGKVSGKIKVQIQPNEALSISPNTFVEIEIPALTKITSAKNLGVVAAVSTNAKSEQQNQVVLKTNIGDKNVTLYTSWSQSIQQVAKDTPQRQQILVQYFSVQLGKEMQDMKSVFKKNKYKHEPENTLAGKFANTYRAMNPQERQALNQYQSVILAKIGKRPGFCIFCGKDEWDSAQDIFKSIGWSLPK